jgi:hypothetical protein
MIYSIVLVYKIPDIITSEAIIAAYNTSSKEGFAKSTGKLILCL